VLDAQATGKRKNVSPRTGCRDDPIGAAGVLAESLLLSFLPNT